MDNVKVSDGADGSVDTTVITIACCCCLYNVMLIGLGLSVENQLFNCTRNNIRDSRVNYNITVSLHVCNNNVFYVSQ